MCQSEKRLFSDRRHDNPGGTCILSQEQQVQFYQTLDEPAADGSP